MYNYFKTATDKRNARAQIVSQIKASGLTAAQAIEINGTTGWIVTTGTGEVVDGYRWAKGEFAVICNWMGNAPGWEPTPHTRGEGR